MRTVDCLTPTSVAVGYRGRAATLVRFDDTDDRIRLYTRIPTAGPEHNLVEQFIVHLLDQPFVTDLHVAVLIEPTMNNGYPDLVFVVYEPTIFSTWWRFRLKLERSDMRLVIYLLLTGYTTIEEMVTHGQRDRKDLIRRLIRLVRAGIVQRQDAETWTIATWDQVLAVRRIVAFEAKMRACQRVIDQVRHHHSFAGESVIVLPTQRLAREWREQLEREGIGFWSSSPAGCREIIPAKVRPLPPGFETMLINDWIGRRLIADGAMTIGDGPDLDYAAWMPGRKKAPVIDTRFAQLTLDWEMSEDVDAQ